jgi:spermidine/putrescine transport system permease protein
MILFFIIYYLPLLSLVVFSFNESKSVTHFTGFSFKWYEELFTDTNILKIVWMTIFIAISATVISTIIGTLASIALVKFSPKKRKLILELNNIPISNADIVTAIGLLLLFVLFNIKMGYITMLLAHVVFCIPYVIVNVYPKMMQMDENLMEAALDLGARPRQAIRTVILPEIKGGILSGAAMAFAMSIDDFVISYFTGGKAQNISIYLYSLIRITPTFNALSTLIVLVIIIKVIIDIIKDKKKNKNKINEENI